MELNAGIVTMASKSTTSHGNHAKEFVRTQIVWIVQTAQLSVKSVLMDMESEMFQTQKISV